MLRILHRAFFRWFSISGSFSSIINWIAGGIKSIYRESSRS
uniref:Uncharacterized protein n=1 Tax=Klebsiella pneumoniae TaxID=573 RepID=A0A8B0SVY1_KLEPN|nr:hypothetical protein [Klebsiella pneumoniae]